MHIHIRIYPGASSYVFIFLCSPHTSVFFIGLWIPLCPGLYLSPLPYTDTAAGSQFLAQPARLAWLQLLTAQVIPLNQTFKGFPLLLGLLH